MTTPPTHDADATAREVWLLATGTDQDLAARLAAFAGAPAALVLAAADPASARQGAAFARQSGCACAALAPGPPAQQLSALAQRVSAGRILVLLPPAPLAELLALALGLPRAHASRLRIDAGRAALLCHDGADFALRHANVLAPERDSGQSLPLGRARP